MTPPLASPLPTLFRFIFIVFVFAPLAIAQAADNRATPEGPSERQSKQAATAERQMVVAANPLAAQAGLDILRQGGSAIDAAIAVQMVLNLVEPQSSGIGGGAFLLHWNAQTKSLNAYDGRETAPALASPDLFLNGDGSPMAFFDAVVGGRSVGVPGLVRMLEMAHAKDGKLPWKVLFQPAIKLARDGFAISPRLYSLLARDKHLPRVEPARSLYYSWGGKPKPIGEVLINRPFAETLQAISDNPDAFYSGPIAEDIVRTVQGAKNAGRLSLSDMKAYRAVDRPAVCGSYRAYKVCGMPPPTSGGVAVLQALGILQAFEISRVAPTSTEAAHLIAEAERLAFADRNRYLADRDFVEVPVEDLLDPAYLTKRAKLISPNHSMGKAIAGDMTMRKGELFGPSASPERPSTSHISIVDQWGNGVSMTSSIENAFGSRLMVRGFLLNNQLTDFSFKPDRDGLPVANRVEPGKRPRSSMAPTMVFSDDGRLYLALGSPGGSRIIPYVIQALVGVVDWDMDAQTTVDQPHISNRNGATELEQDDLKESLEALGHRVSVKTMTSGLHVIRRTKDMKLEGGADPRREGIALGD